MTTKTCTKCKIEKTLDQFSLAKNYKDGVKSECKECVRLRSKEYTAANKAKVREKNRKWWEAHPNYKKEWYEKDRPRQLEMRKQNYRDNKERYAELGRKRQIEHKEELSIYIKDYYQKNKEKIRAKSKEWMEKNKDKHKEYQKIYQCARREKKRKLDSGYYYTPEQWHLMLDFFEHSCVYCGKKVKLTMDHFIPVALGGKTELKNIVPACMSCNQRKSGRHPMEWCDVTTYKYLSSLLAGAA